MLGVGALPLMLAMILSYLQGTKSLQGVIGASFKALAYETSTKIDLLIQREVERNVRLTSEKSIQNSILESNQKLYLLDSFLKDQVLAESKENWESRGIKNMKQDPDRLISFSHNRESKLNKRRIRPWIVIDRSNKNHILFSI